MKNDLSMEPIQLLNISDVNNDWNRAALDLAWAERRRLHDIGPQEADKSKKTESVANHSEGNVSSKVKN